MLVKIKKEKRKQFNTFWILKPEIKNCDIFLLHRKGHQGDIYSGQALSLGKHKRSNAQLNGLKTGNEWENMKVELPRPKRSNVQCCLQHGMHLYQLFNKQIYS
jgi:hypothetical protein